MALGVGLSAADPEKSAPCFDFTRKIDEPLRLPIPLVEGRDEAVFGTYPDGMDWASGRAILDVPIRSAYEKLLDPRHVKDMKKTTLRTTLLDSPLYLRRQEVDVVVTVKVLFTKVKVAWTEAWGYSLVAGTPDDPRKIVISYQKTAGSRHLKHLCGSYVLESREDGRTDLALYEEVRASRRSAEDTRRMHAGILRNLRAPAAEESATRGPAE